MLSIKINAQTKYVHVLVALCDNKNQGIVPVPEKIGNGQDPANNLYWGCSFGVKTFFKNQNNWKLIKQINNPSKYIYERIIFKSKTNNIYLVADAYDGAAIKQTTIDLLNYAAGLRKEKILIDTISIKIGGSADLICYVGHDGLMDFSLDTYPLKTDDKKREVAIFACASKQYFYQSIQKTGAYPLLWTTNLMCPEAYTLEALVNSWMLNKSREEIREKVAQAYHKYQKCGIKGARNLLVTGW